MEYFVICLILASLKNIIIQMEFTLSSAIKANKNDNLHKWTLDYLKTEGKNQKLAEILEESQVMPILSEVALEGLSRIMGPDAGMKFPESEEVWEERVGRVLDLLKGGAELPPLIVTNFWGKISIADGNHRQESLLRLGIKKYWVITYLNDLNLS